jgi:uncharacterized membrane protein YccC
MAPMPARPWGLSVAVALAVGLPLIAGTATDRLALGALGALGALVILHVPPTAPWVPLRRLLGCAAGVAVSPLLGELSTAWPSVTWPLFGVLIAAIVAVTRAVSLPPPGHTVFVLGACAGAAQGFHVSLVPYMLLAPMAGAFGAVAIGAMAGVLWTIALRTSPADGGHAPSVSIAPRLSARAIGLEAMAFGVFAMVALAIAQILGLDKPYWVPISCVAIMRGMTVQAVWSRNVERIVGTLVGVGITLLVLVLHPHPKTIVLIVMLLVLAVHRTMGQNYAMTVLLSTPATLMLTELMSHDRVMDLDLLVTRVQDIVLGSMIGVLGGAVLRSSRFRRITG